MKLRNVEVYNVAGLPEKNASIPQYLDILSEENKVNNSEAFIRGIKWH